MKIKLTKRAVEARLKRAFLSDDKKLKKKGEQYLVVNLKTNAIDKIYKDFAELVSNMDCLEAYEEIEADDNEKIIDLNSIDDLVKVAMIGALEAIDKGLWSADYYGTSGEKWPLKDSDDEYIDHFGEEYPFRHFKENEEILNKLINTFFESFPKPNKNN